MRLVERALGDVLLLEPKVFEDTRGYFFESFNSRAWQALAQTSMLFVQDNQSRSRRNVLRGLHYQITQPQGKIVRCSHGQIFDVCVDLRRSSPTFGQWKGWELSAENQRSVWIPPGFAHGFLAQSEIADCQYKTTDYWDPKSERTILWDDPQLAIAWPLMGEPVLSDKDRAGTLLHQADTFD